MNSIGVGMLGYTRPELVAIAGCDEAAVGEAADAILRSAAAGRRQAVVYGD